MPMVEGCTTCPQCGYEQADLSLDCRSQDCIVACSRCGYYEWDGEGIIYILTNPFMTGWVMIGCTARPLEDCMEELYSEGMISPFICHFAARVKDAFAKTHLLHRLFSDKRGDPTKDFFRIPPEKAVLAIIMGPYTEVIPQVSNISAEEDAVTAKMEQKRSAISLKAIGIQPGAVLTFSRDEGVHATVVSGNRVEYQGQIMSLAAAALSALRQLGYGATKASGCDYWTCQGKTLDEIRNEERR